MGENLKFSKHKEIRERGSYEHYDNYDAIDVPYTDAIPSDYEGIMGVPISFMDKYCPEQFEIIGSDYEVGERIILDVAIKEWTGKFDRGYINGERLYSRLLIRNKNIAK
jgi:hypothetical protein